MADQLAYAAGIAVSILQDERKAAQKWLRGGREPSSDASPVAMHAARIVSLIATASINCDKLQGQRIRRSLSQLLAQLHQELMS